jgi:outer membrane protein TolC
MQISLHDQQRLAILEHRVHAIRVALDFQDLRPDVREILSSHLDEAEAAVLQARAVIDDAA